MSTYAALDLTVSAADDGALTLHVEGPLDYDTSGLFTERTDRALADHPAARVVRLDCSGLSGVDSMGLAVLLGLRRRLDGAGGTLHIIERPPRLDRLLTITGTFDYLVSVESETGDGDPGQPQERR
ncbi:STAS domain-containing protein [Streptomyces sp. NPDC102406]|uniref:STAS domain-containing protein n=1 Tax=Streptomyces sp. NPDC102406 TaxID=3366171 RepID=UPI003820C2AB